MKFLQFFEIAVWQRSWSYRVPYTRAVPYKMSLIVGPYCTHFSNVFFKTLSSVSLNTSFWNINIFLRLQCFSAHLRTSILRKLVANDSPSALKNTKNLMTSFLDIAINSLKERHWWCPWLYTTHGDFRNSLENMWWSHCKPSIEQKH